MYYSTMYCMSYEMYIQRIHIIPFKGQKLKMEDMRVQKEIMEEQMEGYRKGRAGGVEVEAGEEEET